MLGVSLFGTCTVKYNPRVSEQLVARPQIAELHPYQDPDTLQGVLEIVLPDGPDPAGGVRASTSSCSSPAAVPTPPTPTPASPAPTTSRAASWTAPRGDHHDPVAPLQPGHRRGRRLRRDHAAAGGGRLPVARGAEGRRLGPHRGADGRQPRRHGHLQPGHQGVGAARARGRRPRVLRPRQLQRRDGQAAGARDRLRRLHVHAAQDVRRAQDGRRRAGGRRLRLHGRAGAVPARAGRCVRRRALHDGLRPPALDRQDPRVHGQPAGRRAGPTPGRAAWAPTASTRRPTCRCSPTTTWRAA